MDKFVVAVFPDEAGASQMGLYASIPPPFTPPAAPVSTPNGIA